MDCENGVHVLSINDIAYPQRLRAISDPPATLFVKGDLKALHALHSLAIVGTRKPTPYGEKVARKTGATAVREGFSVISGLAVGCDTFGHLGCLEASGLGVAVLAHGLDMVYPSANQGLARRLIENGGCLVSEYPVGTRPSRAAFVKRDRIQSGLSDAVLVIETDVKGGTMHTATFAREQCRPLACIEHPVQWRQASSTKGTQKLLKDGLATPIRDGDALTSFLERIKNDGQGPDAEGIVE